MRCPKCGTKSKIIVKRQADDQIFENSNGYVRLCNNKKCTIILVTVESVVSIVREGKNAPRTGARKG